MWASRSSAEQPGLSYISKWVVHWRANQEWTEVTGIYMRGVEAVDTWAVVPCRRPIAIIDDGDKLPHDCS